MFPDEQLLEHWNVCGESEGRRANSISSREDFARLTTGTLTLEIGPFFSPLVSGAEAYYADWLSTADLRSRALELGAPTEAIPTIHYVLSEHPLCDITTTFESVLSSHVLKHQPDLVGHLVDVAGLLDEGGRYYLLIPDKRYCFDACISLSTIADILEARSHRPLRHSLKSVIEHRALTVHNDPALHWQKQPMHPIEVDTGKVLQAMEEHANAGDGYIDVHAWQFTPQSFRSLMQMLFEMREIDFSVERVYATRYGANEFWAILQKASMEGV